MDHSLFGAWECAECDFYRQECLCHLVFVVADAEVVLRFWEFAEFGEEFID
ncbi:Unannotated [Lentimonas sp. CC19]|nr:Unannotated [Lentimonas sp. CC4]CAA6686493.1 Unannotated [Lentimonas sp. CC6]CAA6690331.1 Unannotated [Lentimonas sp. CC19]CAA7068564.1 Unannotated [Lentimonas sp. CC11]CAA7169394.1 Unannotated [Lentimonas sp. CC21]